MAAIAIAATQAIKKLRIRTSILVTGNKIENPQDQAHQVQLIMTAAFVRVLASNRQLYVGPAAPAHRTDRSLPH